jgi:type IV secretory pathway VirJ component
VPQFESAYDRLTASVASPAAALPTPMADLPLIVVPASGSGPAEWFAIFLTGDGGWARHRGHRRRY